MLEIDDKGGLRISDGIALGRDEGSAVCISRDLRGIICMTHFALSGPVA